MEIATYWLAQLVVTGILIWGLQLLSKALREPSKAAPLGEGSGNRFVIHEVLSEKSAVSQDGVKEGSFSRLSGAIGAIAIAATFAGLGYWVVYSLFFSPADLAQLEHLKNYLLGGAALFAPYAVNQLSSIFR